MLEFFIVAAGTIGFFFTICAVICWINVLTPAFETNLVWGTICLVVPFVPAFLWGWAQAGKHNLKTNMTTWTVCLIPTVVFLCFVRRSPAISAACFTETTSSISRKRTTKSASPSRGSRSLLCVERGTGGAALAYDSARRGEDQSMTSSATSECAIPPGAPRSKTCHCA